MIMTLQEERLKSLEEFLRGTAGLSAQMVGTEAEELAAVENHQGPMLPHLNPSV
jgi:hypothetical protein